MEMHFEVVNPVMHYLVFDVFFAEGFAHAVDEVAPSLGLDVDEFGELCEVQVHYKVLLVFGDVVVGCHFIHERSFPDEVVFFVVACGFFAFVVNENIRILERVRNGEVLVRSPEFEDCARCARAHDVTPRQVYDAAVRGKQVRKSGRNT